MTVNNPRCPSEHLSSSPTLGVARIAWRAAGGAAGQRAYLMLASLPSGRCGLLGRRRLRQPMAGHQLPRASHHDYDELVVPTGPPIGTCQDALDTAAASTSTTPPPGPDPDELPGETTKSGSVSWSTTWRTRRVLTSQAGCQALAGGRMFRWPGGRGWRVAGVRGRRVPDGRSGCGSAAVSGRAGRGQGWGGVGGKPRGNPGAVGEGCLRGFPPTWVLSRPLAGRRGAGGRGVFGGGPSKA